MLAGVHLSNYVTWFVDHAAESGSCRDYCCICDYLTKGIVAGVHSVLSGVPVKMLFSFIMRVGHKPMEVMSTWSLCSLRIELILT
jgi:hypothetical protein